MGNMGMAGREYHEKMLRLESESPGGSNWRYATEMELVEEALRTKEGLPLALATEGPIVNRSHPFYHFCRKCINLVKVMLVAFVVEVLMFYPTHLLFHELGWL